MPEKTNTTQPAENVHKNISLEDLLKWSPEDLNVALNNPEYKEIIFKIELAQFILKQKNKDKIDQISSELINGYKRLEEADKNFLEGNYKNIHQKFVDEIAKPSKVSKNIKNKQSPNTPKKNGFGIGD